VLQRGHTFGEAGAVHDQRPRGKVAGVEDVTRVIFDYHVAVQLSNFILSMFPIIFTSFFFLKE
jgi:hypothetical protein